MKRYRVTALLTITVSTVVEASTAQRAKHVAMGRGVMSLCNQCAQCNGEAEEWVINDRLDGEPQEVDVIEEEL